MTQAAAAPATMHTRPYRLRVVTHDRGNFQSIRDSNVLIYWPHGFGDWVQFAYLLPLLDRSNRYWMTRFGDDNTAVMENHEFVTPVYLGANSTHCADGGDFGNRHFGIEYAQADGSELTLDLPASLYELCRANHIDFMLWSAFPESAGCVLYPFHSKARNLIPYLVAPERIQGATLSRPLPSSISFAVPACITRLVESRLRNFAGFGPRKMCIVGRNGYTSVGKNWGHLWREDLEPDRRREGEECRDFIKLLLRKDSGWMFLVAEDKLFQGDHTIRASDCNTYSYAELFGTPDTPALPFGLVMKVLANLADLCVGVPAAPYHFCLAKPGLPTVGIWMEHLPSWFDEPKTASLHLVSRNLRDCQLDRRPGSFTCNADLEFRLTWMDTRIVTGEAVLNAVEDLLF